MKVTPAVILVLLAPEVVFGDPGGGPPDPGPEKPATIISVLLDHQLATDSAVDVSSFE